MSRVRVGSVDYLNARPLTWGLERDERIELSADTPSRLAERMRAGELDIALLPTIELGRIPELELVPGLGIVTQGPARSVLLVARRPLPELRSVALDPESRTSNALVQVLCAEVWGVHPAFHVEQRLELQQLLAEHDAAVRIGDKALFEPLSPELHVHDLGAAWSARTGLPFVFAAWAARPGLVDRELYRTLHDSRRAGMHALDEIAEGYRWNGRCDPALARAYLREHIRYRFGSAELRGLELFLAACARIGLLERAPRVRLALQRITECHTAAARSA